MKKFLRPFAIVVALLFSVCLLMWKRAATLPEKHFLYVESKEEEDDERAEFVKQRLEYELGITKDPATGKIPLNIRAQEMEVARSIPARQSAGASNREAVLNSYLAAGPDNIGGRTRAIVFDKRYSATGVMLAASVSGGIYRSANKGLNWTKVSPQDQVNAISTIAQDPRSGFQNTWYAAGGEPLGNSAAAAGAFYYGYGILKSTDNGLTWTRLTLTITDIDGTTLGAGSIEGFDNVFDIVHKIAVNPGNGDLFICGHRRLVRSTDGGSTFQVVFKGRSVSTADVGQMDILFSTSGRLFLAVNGGFPNIAQRGIFSSSTGAVNSFVRIAGGPSGSADSTDGWRGNAYPATSTTANATTGIPDSTYESKRILLALDPSNQNRLFALYENGLSQASGKENKPEVDLFRFDVSTPIPTSTNLSANMPDFPGTLDGVDPIAVQGGYDMVLAVSPANPSLVIIGGTNLYRSTDGFTSTTNTEWIGGYRKANPPTANVYDSSHPDQHVVAFDPAVPNRMLVGNDGGMQATQDITAATVAWSNISNYQSLQYYFVAMVPSAGQNYFLGGAQDNGCYLRNVAQASPNSHNKILGGDGAAVAIASVNSPDFTFYVTSQQGTIYRDIKNNFVDIKPNGLTANTDGGFGDFVTYFKLDFNTPEDLYYANFNRIFRTKSGSTVTNGTWEEVTGIAAKIPATITGTTAKNAIRSMELSRGSYAATHALYMGTAEGKLYRLDDPQNAVATTQPIDISPTLPAGANIADIAVNPNDDAEVMLVVSNYGTTSIWWTNNAKTATPTWTNAEGNLTLPSIRSCMIVVKKDGAGTPVREYYVGTSVGLYSATNIATTLGSGGTISWAREGADILGFDIITSMDYRPEDNALLVGTHGNGMFYTIVGTPNFTPNLNTGVNDPIRNDQHFIKYAYNDIGGNTISFQIGDMYTVKKMVLKIHNLQGQELLRKESAYQSGTLDISILPRGAYVLSITSSDNKQQFIRKMIR